MYAKNSDAYVFLLTAYVRTRTHPPIIQREIIDTAIKVRDANSVGLPTVARDKKIQLFALLRVRRAMREAVA